MLSLPTALRLDAIVSGANDVAYLVAAGPIGDLLGLSPALLRGAGAVLLAFAAFVWLVASPASGPSRAASAAVIAMNAAWAAGSLLAAIAQYRCCFVRRLRQGRELPLTRPTRARTSAGR